MFERIICFVFLVEENHVVAIHRMLEAFSSVVSVFDMYIFNLNCGLTIIKY